MRREIPGQAGYYREQAMRVRKRAELALTQEQRESLLELAQRWEKLAVGTEGLSEKNVRREAALFARRFPQNPAGEAAHCASRAYEAGDLVNFETWTRIAKAILELDHKTPRRRRLH